MVKKVTILHFASPPIVGGVEITIYHHARYLSKMGYKVEVIAGRGGSFHPDVKFHKVEEVDSRYSQALEINKQLAGGQVPSSFYDLRDRIFEVLFPLLEGTKTCIVHNAITLHKNLSLTAALKKLSEQNLTHFVAWCHDFAWQDELYQSDLHQGYPWDLLRTSWPGVDYVVVSEHRRSQLAELLGKPIEEIQVVTPGIDVADFLKLEKLTRDLIDDLNLMQSDPILLLPARITRRKNIEYAIKVVAALKDAHPHVALIVTGPPGPHNPTNVAYLKSLSELSCELGVTENIHFLYQHNENDQPLHVPDEVVGDLYRISDALLFPSQREGFGIPVLESGLTRLPVFAANIPPIRESGGDYVHLFNPNGDPDIVAQVIKVYFNRNKAYQLRRRILDRYSWDHIVQDKLIPIINP
jgi:glycosyltransferase involved in cell wall biosynthesis